MLAPAVMINACGLLLLGISNKYSSMMNRIRLLNEEKRRYYFKVKENKEMDYLELSRFQSIRKQIRELQYRLKLVRNVIISYAVALFLFIFTSLLIGVEAVAGANITKYIFISTFALGMISIAIGLIYLLTDTLRGYNIINVEVKADE
jgi:uncharacterized membrane protein (DUF106 family)